MTNLSTGSPETDFKTKRNTLAERLILIFSALCTILALVWVLWFCRHGIDFADEGFYLAWISNPYKYSFSATQFGFIYHPVYVLFKGNVALLRQFNVALTFLLAAALVNLFLRKILGEDSPKAFSRYVISGAISTASLLFWRLWLPTPNYNSLTFQALLITASGLILSDNKPTAKSALGWLLIGLGGWLAFMAKPTTAAVLCLCSGTYLLAAGKFNARLSVFTIAVTLGLVCLSALLIDGSIFVFVNRLQTGAQFAKLLGAGYNSAHLFRLDDIEFTLKTKVILISTTSLFFTSAFLAQSKQQLYRYSGYVLLVSVGIGTLMVISGTYQQAIDAGPFQHLLIWSIPLAAILLSQALSQFKGIIQISKSQWALALCLTVLPYAFAFGTANNYWWMEGLVGIFWILAGLVFLSPISINRNLTNSLLALGFGTQIITVTQILVSTEFPYGQPAPLRENTYRIEIGASKNTLLVSNKYGEYISNAIEIAKRADFKNETPMIDLTGHSPGLLYAIGASNTGEPWIIGDYSKLTKSSYSGINEVAVKALRMTSCDELSKAWILTEPKGPVPLSVGVLSSFGADFAKDFEVVGTFETTAFVGGFKEIQTQEISRPIRPLRTAISACANSRGSKK
ncbi:hypothetical protein [Paraburkholderia hospita]|uniref:hypothetical protein n=1 Tax=Paraburkholderia hospita TaxID=169430 RepID=UPI0011779A80|nr:hypothetical protein [Paraburkholderia hospita]